MLDPKKIEEIARQVGAIFPPQLKQFADETEAKVKQLLQAKLAELDFVSREEFEVQRQVLLRTRQKVEAMEAQLAALTANSTVAVISSELPSSDQQ